MTNQLKTSILMLLFSIALGSCEKQISITPKEKSSEQTQIAAQAEGKTQDGKKAFDPCKWVWGDNFKSEKGKSYNFFKNQIKSMCSTTAIKQTMIVDSVTICFDSLERYNQWLILYLDNKQQIIKLEVGGFQGWQFDSNLCDANICFGHYNYDNYLDFHLYERGGTAGSDFWFYLYNNKKKIFEKSEILSAEHSISYNQGKNIYQSWSRGGPIDFKAERFIIINDKKKILKAIDVSTAEISGDYSVIRKYMTETDTLINIYKIDEFQRNAAMHFKQDKYCKEFIEFMKKYRLK